MIAPLFPLPNVVLFPKTLVPLHIFEERYRAMVKSALGSDAMIAVVLVREDLPPEPPDKPPVHEIACLGKIETYEELEGGRYNILVAGTRRIRLLREVESAPYRRAEVELLNDLTMRDLFLLDDSTQLRLNGHTLTLKVAFHDDWGTTNRVVYDGGLIVWAVLGSVFMVR